MFSVKARNSSLLGPLQFVTGVVERRHTLAILSNVLIEIQDQNISFIATDLEVQIKATARLENPQTNGSLTVAAKKLQDILRALPPDSDVTLDNKDSRMTVKASKSRFALQTLAADDFPKIAESADNVSEITLPQRELKHVLSKVQFAMAIQHIRYYLNGVQLSTEGNTLRVVATDGHRLSMATYTLPEPVSNIEAILPRKTVLELIKLLDESDDPVRVLVHSNQVKFSFGGIEIISKIIEGKSPDYNKVIPTGYTNHVSINRIELLHSMQRASILSTDKIRGVRLVLTKDSLSVVCSNTEGEEAEDSLQIEYDREALDIAFNIAYLLDVLNNLTEENILISLGDATTSSTVVSVPGSDNFKYVVMPMRL